MSELALSLRNVGVRLYRRHGALGLKVSAFWALQDVSFDVPRGSVVGVVGRNGSGKSTLLRSLAGIIAPDRGSIRNHGVSVCLLTLQAGFVESLSGRENAVLSGMLLGLPRKKVEAALPEIREFSEIGDWFEEPVRTYSSGMKARLGFSIAINVQADLILLDETLSVGDAGFREKSAAAMQKLIKSERTVVLVSNNINVVAQLSDSVVWLDAGRSIEVAAPKSLPAAYNRFFREIPLATPPEATREAIQRLLEEERQKLLPAAPKQSPQPA